MVVPGSKDSFKDNAFGSKKNDQVEAIDPFDSAANELQAFCGASGVRVMPTSGTPQMPSTPNAQFLNGTTPI